MQQRQSGAYTSVPAVLALGLAMVVLLMNTLFVDHGQALMDWNTNSSRQLSSKALKSPSSSFQDTIVVFLDIDGVLSLWPLGEEEDEEESGDLEAEDDRYYNIDPETDNEPMLDEPADISDYENCDKPILIRTVAAFSKLWDALPEDKRRLVLSSSWRLNKGCPELIMEAFKAYGDEYGGPLADFDGFDDVNGKYQKSRQSEIASWHHGNNERVAAWIVLDDLESTSIELKHYEFFQDHVVITGGKVGLTDEDAEEAIELIEMQLGKEDLSGA